MTHTRTPKGIARIAGSFNTFSGLEPLEARTLLAAIDLTLGTAHPLFTSDTTPALAGTVSDVTADVSVTIRHGADTVGTWAAVTDGAGAWSFTPADPDALADGTYSLVVDATANAGADTGELSLADSIVIDTADPTVAIGAGQLPATVKAATTLTGTFADANISGIVVTLDNGSGGTFDFTAVLDSGAGAWSVSVPLTGLADGAYTVTAKATDLAGNTATANGAGALTVDTTAPAVAMATLATTSTRPALTGTVGDTTATVTVTVRGANYTAVNNGDGTWTLAADTIAALPDGTFRVTVTAADGAGNQTVFDTARLIVDTTAPTVTVDKLVTAITSPALTGTVNDNAATVVVKVNAVDYTAVNNGDGTWTLAAGTVPALAQGVYSVTATATDALGNAATETTTNELTVGTTQQVVMGAAVTKITYVDTDGTAVTVLAGRGAITLSLTGVNLAVAGTGASRTVTATGGIAQVDVAVTGASSSLTFKAGASGDGLTEIHAVTGSGTLGSLIGNGLNVTGGITMTGVIKTMRLHDILSDVTMGTWTGGVYIMANAITGSDIKTPIIRTLTANTFTGSTIDVTTLKAMTAKTSFQSTSVTATTIGTVRLWNVTVDNGGVDFGLTASTLRSLQLVQGLRLKHGRGHVVLTWGRSFTTGIEDFQVDV